MGGPLLQTLHMCIGGSYIKVDSRSNPSVMHVTLQPDMADVGITIHLGRTHNLLCPVSAVLAYLSIRPVTPGPFSYFSLVCHCQGSTWSQPFVELSHLLVWIPHSFTVTVSV